MGGHRSDSTVAEGQKKADLIPPLVVRSESVRNIIRERRMLEHVNHPFICNLRYSFQDIEYMYGETPSALQTPD